MSFVFLSNYVKCLMRICGKNKQRRKRGSHKRSPVETNQHLLKHTPIKLQLNKFKRPVGHHLVERWYIFEWKHLYYNLQRKRVICSIDVLPVHQNVRGETIQFRTIPKVYLKYIHLTSIYYYQWNSKETKINSDVKLYKINLRPSKN